MNSAGTSVGLHVSLGEDARVSVAHDASAPWTLRAHPAPAPIAGWCVLELTRKAATLDELTAQESQEFGLILSKVSAAVREATKCERAYRPGRILRRIPISIGSDAWIAAATFVGPGVYIGNGVVLGARAAAFRDLPDWIVCVGVPAKPYRARLKPKNAG